MIIKYFLQGKTVYRTLFTKLISKNCKNLNGKVLDLAGGKQPSYLPFLSKNAELIRSDVEASSDVIAIDFNKTFPCEDNSFDTVLCFNALYITHNPIFVLREIKRILKPNGSLHLVTPFIFAEIPEPHDYARHTKEGLSYILSEAGFTNTETERFGERFTVIMNILHPFFLHGIIRTPFCLLAIFLDKLIPKKLKLAHPAPLGYYSIAK